MLKSIISTLEAESGASRELWASSSRRNMTRLLEEESNREREQHTRGPLLISCPLQTNDNESTQHFRIIMLQKKRQHLPCSPQLECRTRRHGHNKSVVNTERNWNRQDAVTPFVGEDNLLDVMGLQLLNVQVPSFEQKKKQQQVTYHASPWTGAFSRK